MNCNLVNSGASRRSDTQPANATSDASAGKSTTAPASTTVVVAPAASHVSDLPGSREERGAAAVQTHVSVRSVRAA